MSTPQNPLAKFRSYSYYHVLALCSSTTCAQALIDSTDDPNNQNSVWNFSSDTSGKLGLNSVKKITPNGGKEGKYCILINDSQSATFNISKLKYDTHLRANIVENDRGTSFAQLGEFTVSEPRGILFLDRVVRCTQELGVDPNSVIWVVKTFFVGYTDKDQVEYVSDTHPFVCIPNDIIGSFTEQGGLYEVSAVATHGGISRLPQYSMPMFTINFETGNNLKEGCHNIEVALQEMYDKHFECIKAQIQQYPNSDKRIKALRPFSFKINLDSKYEDPSYTITNQQTQLKVDGSNCSDGTTSSIPSGTNVETGIHNLFSMCEKVQKEQASKNPANRFQPSINPAIVSEDVGDGLIDYTSMYTITRDPLLDGNQVNNIHSDGYRTTEDEKPNNVIQFEYIYTGHNTDILNFDMKINMGNVYIRSSLVTGNYRDGIGNQSIQSQVVSPKDAFLTDRTLQTSLNMPVHLGSSGKINNPLITGANSPNLGSYAAMNLALQSSVDMATAAIKIMGNSDLLGNVMKKSAPPIDGVLLGSSISYAKIHVKMPRNNDDYSLFTGGGGESNITNSSSGNDYAVDYWYNGVYAILSIEHNFDEGNFTQELQLVTLNRPDEETAKLFNSRSISETENESAIPTTPKECQYSLIPCKGSKPAIPEPAPITSITSSIMKPVDKNTTPDYTALEAGRNAPITDSSIAGQIDSVTKGKDKGNPLELPVHPELLKDNDITSDMVLDPSQSEAINDKIINSGNMDKLKGWNETTPEVRQAIEQAARKHHLNVLEFAKIASVESKFKPRAFNRRQSGALNAVGLFQFVGSTFKGITGSLDPSGDERKNPFINADAAAKLTIQNYNSMKNKSLYRNENVNQTGLLYAYHNQGPMFDQIYKSCQQGIQQPTSDKMLASMKTQAKEIYHPGISLCQFVENVKKFPNLYYGGKVSHVPHASTVGPRVDAENVKARTNRDMISNIGNCDLQQEIKNDESKTGCGENTDN